MAASTQGNITYAATIENLNVLDQSYYNRLLDAFVAQDIAQALLIYKEIRNQGFDSQFFVNGLASYLRDLAVAQNPDTLPLLEATDEVRAQMAERASSCTRHSSTRPWTFATMPTSTSAPQATNSF